MNKQNVTINGQPVDARLSCDFSEIRDYTGYALTNGSTTVPIEPPLITYESIERLWNKAYFQNIINMWWSYYEK